MKNPVRSGLTPTKKNSLPRLAELAALCGRHKTGQSEGITSTDTRVGRCSFPFHNHR